jgi:hypothetical protein
MRDDTATCGSAELATRAEGNMVLADVHVGDATPASRCSPVIDRRGVTGNPSPSMGEGLE